jgi:hypothetical protein
MVTRTSSNNQIFVKSCWRRSCHWPIRQKR